MISSTRWRPSDGLSLEPNALAAAKETSRNLALTAGPGAGKTEMLAQRADFLLRTGTCYYPKRILAISFKVDASRNLKARVRKRCGNELAARLDSHTFHAFAKRIIDRFRAALTGRDALNSDYTIGPARIHRTTITFNDMVPLAVKIVENSVIARNAIRQTYSHVFLDEFQDCTKIQYQLIKACFHDTSAQLTAVGDTKQRIMGWAGALEGIFETYADDFQALPLNLYQNFRSEMRLRRMQNAMVRVMDEEAALDDADLEGDDGEIQLRRFDSDDDEADGIAEQIRLWIEEEEEISPAEIAVLVSKQQRLYCRKLCAAMEGLGVPFREEDDVQDLVSEPAASLIIDFFLVVLKTRQPAPHQRLLDLIVFGQGDDEAEYRMRSRWEHYIAEIRQKRRSGELDLAVRETLTELVDGLVGLLGREAVVALSLDYSQGVRLDQVMSDTLDRVQELASNGEDLEAGLASFSGDESVRIMSIHKSKGLEFDSVIVLGVENETFWGDDDEERSAYFVAISRAKRRLLLTVAEQRARPVGYSKRWDVARTDHEEFIGYAEAYA